MIFLDITDGVSYLHLSLSIPSMFFQILQEAFAREVVKVVSAVHATARAKVRSTEDVGCFPLSFSLEMLPTVLGRRGGWGG